MSLSAIESPRAGWPEARQGAVPGPTPGAAPVRRIIGIDPGLNGALALIDERLGLYVEDMPTLTIGTKRQIDHYAVARLIDNWTGGSPTTVYIEQVGTRPGEGAVGAFSFGRGFGVLLGVCAANFLPIELVTPAQWKTAMRCKGDKDESRARASALLPDFAHHWPLKKHDGRAEATLIALYGRNQIASAGAGPP